MLHIPHSTMLMREIISVYSTALSEIARHAQEQDSKRNVFFLQQNKLINEI